MISAIVAVDANWGIGFNGELLERIPEDMKHFKELTMDNIVIMGRKTWDSLPGVLRHRINIVISSKLWLDGSVAYTTSMEYVQDTLNQLRTGAAYCDKDIFIIGGGSIYEQLLPYCDRVYLTKIHKSHENIDTYFPIDLNEWRLIEASETREYNLIPYTFLTYERV